MTDDELQNEAVFVASHNIMCGLRLSELLEHYSKLRSDASLDVLCIQENRYNGHEPHAEVIASHLGDRYAYCCEPGRKGNATLYDTRRLKFVEYFLLPMPRLERLTMLERLYIAGGKSSENRALVCVFERLDGEKLTVVNIHLDAAGTNEHRQRQIKSIARGLRARGIHKRIVVCGDTNAFCFNRNRHPDVVRQVMRPVIEMGLRGPKDAKPTHYFARQGESLLTHRLCKLLGKLGIDLPLPTDMVFTDRPVHDRGQITTPESDHDLVWAQILV